METWLDPLVLSGMLISIATLYICCFRRKSIKQSLLHNESRADDRALRKQLDGARATLTELIRKHNCAPILLRLAWSDAASFDGNGKVWPVAGGCTGSIRSDTELAHPNNGGLAKACAYLAPVKAAFPLVSWADLIQMSGALAVQMTGGPRIHMKYGRRDADSAPPRTPKSSRLPCPCYPFPDKAITPTVHVRNVFSRLGFSTAETVALMGGHTLGRAFKDRSGVCENQSGDQGATAYTRQNSVAKADGSAGVGMAGGMSWTKLWLQFDNSYFQQRLQTPADDALLWLPTDDALLQCPEYKPFFLKFAGNQDAFFITYSAAHKKMSELGAQFEPHEGIYLD